MPQSIEEQNELIKKEFTKQAEAYAFNPTIVDPDWAQRLVYNVAPTGQERLLEVATGPGYVAMAFAPHVREVVGVDLTDAPLAIAEKTRQERNLENVRFQKGDANQLPFDDNTFDLVVCRLAVHHFADPKWVIDEMARVCRPGGKVAVEDLVSSEVAERAEHYNHWERLRDPSHVVALSITQLLAYFTDAGLEVEQIQSENRRQVAEQWMRNSQTPEDVAAEVRALIRTDMEQNLSGISIYLGDDEQLCFDHRMVTVVGRKSRRIGI